MKLVTFQPLTVLNKLNETGVYTPEYSDWLGQRVFCVKMDEDTREKLFLTAPSMPQVALYLDVPDNEIEVIDSVAWANYLALDTDYEENKNLNSGYLEYAVSKITKEQLIESSVITESSDSNFVQEEYQNKHFEEIEKLSGSKWYTVGDKEMQEFWGTNRAMIFVTLIHRCMMPFERITTVNDFNKASRLINKYFRVCQGEV